LAVLRDAVTYIYGIDFERIDFLEYLALNTIVFVIHLTIKWIVAIFVVLSNLFFPINLAAFY
jgi:hypothetical protein